MKMKYLKLGIACLAATTSVAFADLSDYMITSPMGFGESNYFDGGYLGLAAGITYITADDTVGSTILDETIGESRGQFTWTREADMGNYSAIAKVLAGYGKVFDENWYLGGELFASYSPIEIDFHYLRTDYFSLPDEEIIMADFKHEVKMDYSYGAVIRAGYLPAPQTLFYILLGYTRAKLNINDIAAIVGSWSADETRLQNINGFMAGLGLETYLASNISLRTEYTYTHYNGFSYQDSYAPPLSAPVTERSVNTKQSTRMEQGTFSIGLAYHF